MEMCARYSPPGRAWALPWDPEGRASQLPGDPKEGASPWDLGTDTPTITPLQRNSTLDEAREAGLGSPGILRSINWQRKA